MRPEANANVETAAAPMTPYRAIGLAEGFEDGTPDEQLEAWQYLVDTGLAWTLQGCFGRTAAELIRQGLIHG